MAYHEQVAVGLQVIRQRIGQLIQVQAFPNVRKIGDVIIFFKVLPLFKTKKVIQ